MLKTTVSESDTAKMAYKYKTWHTAWHQSQEIKAQTRMFWDKISLLSVYTWPKCSLHVVTRPKQRKSNIFQTSHAHMGRFYSSMFVYSLLKLVGARPDLQEKKWTKNSQMTTKTDLMTMISNFSVQGSNFQVLPLGVKKHKRKTK